jgi:hypothetical protein
MALSMNDYQAMMKGFERAGFVCTGAPTSVVNPVRIEWHLENEVRRYRLWAFDITHGGGGPEVRAERVQVGT